MQTAYVNGDLVALADAQVSVLDRGFLFSDAVYEVIPVYAGQPFMLDAHLQRLHNSLAGIRLANPKPAADWAELVRELITVNGGGDLAVYLQVTRGTQPQRSHRLPASPQPTIVAFCQPRTAPDPATFTQGVAVITRADDRWGHCEVKSTSLLANILATDEALSSGAAEAILVRDGLVMEGASSNVFAVIDNVLTTPALRPEILPGITREFIIDLARANAIACRQADLSLQSLRSASEIWLTSSTREIYPVTRLDEAVVGTGKPGSLWQTMHALVQGNPHA